MKNIWLTGVLALVIIVASISGCIESKTPAQLTMAQPTATQPAMTQSIPTPPVTTSKPEETLISTETRIGEMQNEITLLQNDVAILKEQTNVMRDRLNDVGLLNLTPSNKSLIPKVPFNIEVYFADWQTPLTYRFKENGEVEITPDKEIASYVLYYNNNTIRLKSSKYKLYGLRLYENNIASIWDNGWIEWVVSTYKVFPPKYNPETQKYELH